MTMRNPEISVIMPVYNAEAYLEEAIDSVLCQSFSNFELLLINDGSTDRSKAIIESYVENEKVRVIENGKNLGLIASLNKGIIAAKGEYLARMDADDVCLPGRFKTQIEFMRANQDIVLTGGSVICHFEDYKVNQYFPLDFNSIKAEALFNCPFSHPTVMVRRSYLVQNGLRYEEAFKYAEDYALWQKIIGNAKACNMPLFFAKYRVLSTGQTGKAINNADERLKIISDIQRIGLERLGIINREYEARLHYQLSLSDRISELSFNEYPVKVIAGYLNKIVGQNYISEYCKPAELKGILGKIWLKVIYINKLKLSFWDMGYMLTSKFFFIGLVWFIKMKIKFFRNRIN